MDNYISFRRQRYTAANGPLVAISHGKAVKVYGQPLRKDVFAKIYQMIEFFFYNFCCSQIMSYWYLYQKCKNSIIGDTDLLSEIKWAEKLPFFRKKIVSHYSV